MVYSITYDLNKSGQNYNDLYKAIESLGECCHYLKSTWFINTNCSVDEIKHLLLTHMDENDFLFVSQVSRYSTKLRTKADEWLMKHVNHI